MTVLIVFLSPNFESGKQRFEARKRMTVLRIKPRASKIESACESAAPLEHDDELFSEFETPQFAAEIIADSPSQSKAFLSCDVSDVKPVSSSPGLSVTTSLDFKTTVVNERVTISMLCSGELLHTQDRQNCSVKISQSMNRHGTKGACGAFKLEACGCHTSVWHDHVHLGEVFAHDLKSKVSPVS